MSAFKGTPGPWVAKGTRVMPPDSCGHIACCGIAECYHGSNEEEAEANARLIAAAPESHEACVLFVEAIDYLYNITPAWCDDRIYDELPSSGLAIAYLAARAAIAKATGEQQ